MTAIHVAPHTEDGRPILMPLTFDEGVFLYVCGSGDAPVADGRGEGNRFQLSRSTTGDSTVEWQFNDPVKIVGGTGRYTGAEIGDEISMEVIAPATTVEAVTPGTGSVALVDTTYDVEGNDLFVVVPMPGGTGGTHNVTNAIPVPASVGEQSFYSWVPDPTMIGHGTTTPAANGGFNLYTIDVPLARQVTHFQLIGSGDLSVEIDNVKPLLMLPHWKFKATLTSVGAHTVSVTWALKVSRTRTTKIW